jgi:hypothetical protein
MIPTMLEYCNKGLFHIKGTLSEVENSIQLSIINTQKRAQLNNKVNQGKNCRGYHKKGKDTYSELLHQHMNIP